MCFESSYKAIKVLNSGRDATNFFPTGAVVPHIVYYYVFNRRLFIYSGWFPASEGEAGDQPECVWM